MIEALEVDETRNWMQLVDDAYDTWRAAENECGQILREWFATSDQLEPIVYLAYRAALDREEASARALQRLWQSPESHRANFMGRAPSGCRR